MIVTLVLASLLLPPVSAQERIFDAGYAQFDQDEGGSVVDPDGMQVTLLAEGLDKDVKAKSESVPMASFLDGSAGKDLEEAAGALPSNLHVKSPIYEIKSRGPSPPT